MDAETMMTMDGLSRMIEFMRDAFPWISLLALLITIVGVMLKEKRKRAFVLEQSGEEARIEALPDLSAEQKEQLLKAAAPLPATKEAFPLPDLPLRLVSALCKVFGLLKIVLLLGSAYMMMRIASGPNPTKDNEHPIVFFILVTLTVVLAVAQIVASTKVTRGGNGARRFLIFMAVLELGGAVRAPGMAFESVWIFILITMSAYTLWVLLFRKRAQRAVLWEFAPTRLWQKVAVLILCILSFTTELFNFSMETTATNSNVRLESNSSSSEVGGIIMPIERIVLRAGDPSKDTLALMRLLQEELNVPTEVLGFDAAPSSSLSGGDMYLLVSKAVDGKVKKPQNEMSRTTLRHIAKDNPGIADLFSRPFAADEIAFTIQTPFSHDSFTPLSGKWAMHCMSAADIKLTQRAEYTTLSRDQVLEKIADAVAKTFNTHIQQCTEKVSLLEFPEALAGEPEPMPAPELVCMADAVPLGSYFSPQQQISCYRVSAFSDEALVAVSNELVQIGWVHDWDQQYSKGNEKILLRGQKKYSRDDPWPYLHLIHSQERKVELPESFAEDFCRENYADFNSIFYAKAVPADVLQAAMWAHLKNPDLSARELYRMYESISRSDELVDLRSETLFRFARVLREEPMSEYLFDLYRNLGQAISVAHDKVPDACEKITELYGDQIIHLELETDTNGFDRAEITVQGIDRPPLITISKKIRNDPSGRREFLPFYFQAWAEVLEEGLYKVYSATTQGRRTSESADPNSAYTVIHSFSVSNGDAGNCTWGELGARDRSSIEEWTRPGDLCVIHQISPRTNELSVAILFKDDRLFVTRAADGDYFLNNERMANDELLLALLEYQVINEHCRVVALLEKEDRAEFKALLSDSSIEKRQVKYEDPPPGVL
ncbi:hypothetical protein P4C99_14050 [Pontiellaceae bacterium B1224]|nr:hypothetical protein [Pontiellaceae bacterium B1224]